MAAPPVQHHQIDPHGEIRRAVVHGRVQHVPHGRPLACVAPTPCHGVTDPPLGAGGVCGRVQRAVRCRATPRRNHHTTAWCRACPYNPVRLRSARRQPLPVLPGRPLQSQTTKAPQPPAATPYQASRGSGRGFGLRLRQSSCCTSHGRYNGSRSKTSRGSLPTGPQNTPGFFSGAANTVAERPRGYPQLFRRFIG